MICALAGKQSEVERGWLKPQGLEPPALGVLAGLSERVTPGDLGEVPPGRAGKNQCRYPESRHKELGAFKGQHENSAGSRYGLGRRDKV